MSSKKLMLFLASEKGYMALETLVCGIHRSMVGCVVTFKEIDVEKSWDTAIKALCTRENIPCFLWQNVKTLLEELIQKYRITGAVAISWKYLLPLTINQQLEDHLIVFHDSLLPKYRGFAPTPTAIMCGETQVGVTALYASDQVDQGDIILQTPIYVPKHMYIADVIKAEGNVYGVMLEEIVERMVQNCLTSYPQNEEEATYSIWRNTDDCHIEWEKSAGDIYNFVRAVSSPYPCAFTFLEKQKIKILRAEPLPGDRVFQIRDTGKIWSILENKPEVICGAGMLRILSAVDENGQQVIFRKVRCRLE